MVLVWVLPLLLVSSLLGAFLSLMLLLRVDAGGGLEPGAGAGLTGPEPGACRADGTKGTEGPEVILSSSSPSPPESPCSGETGVLMPEVTLAVSSLVPGQALVKLLCWTSSIFAQVV